MELLIARDDKEAFEALQPEDLTIGKAVLWPSNGTYHLMVSKNNQFHSRTKHIELQHRFVTQLFDDNVLYIPTKEMV